MTFSYKVEHPSEEEDTRAQQSPMETVNLILPLEMMTVNNPNNSSVVTAGEMVEATAGMTAGALIE